MLAVRIGQLTAEVFHLLDLQPCWLLLPNSDILARPFENGKALSGLRHCRKGACPITGIPSAQGGTWLEDHPALALCDLIAISRVVIAVVIAAVRKHFVRVLGRVVHEPLHANPVCCVIGIATPLVLGELREHA
jgi:hypothetical protein